MYKLKRIVFNIILLSFIIKANECYGMKMNEKKDGKTVIEEIKALPYSKIFIYGNKFFFSLAHSIINNFYELETLEMNKLYFLKKYLCVGYRLQPTFLAPFSFLDFNVNILGGIIDTAIFLYLYRSSGIKTPSKIFYSLTSFLNINLNIRIKSDFYISINIVGLMRAIFYAFLIKNSNNNENIINLDNNLSGNNNSEYNSECNNENFNQEKNNNNPENNNEDIIWEKIKKDLEKEQKDEGIIQKIYKELEYDYGIYYRFNEEEVKKIIAENIENREEIKRIIENMILTKE